MAGASDKARFFLEQTVPELREWERREIFQKEEISAIAAKRSDFEHLLNARGARPADFARYAEYEMNLDSLRRKRVKRKGLKSTAHTGQQRIFSILKRGTSKFPGDIPLWMQYVDYSRKQHANKRVVKVLTDLLRLHPTKPDLWIYAARYVFDVQADITAARSYMQRALRFCPLSSSIHLEYARLEMSHLAKIFARRTVLGLDASLEPQSEVVRTVDETSPDVISLTAGAETRSDMLGPVRDEDNWNNIASTPAMKGAIPLAIFNAAIDRFHKNAGSIGLDFFNMFAGYVQLPCGPSILDSVTNRLLSVTSSYLQGLGCQCRLPIIGTSYQDPGFPAALRTVLGQIKSAMAEADSQKSEVADAILTWLAPLAQDPSLLPELGQVLKNTERQLLKIRSQHAKATDG